MGNSRARIVLEIRTYRLKAGTSDAFHQLVVEQSVPLLRRFGIEVVRFGSSEQNEMGVEEYILIHAFRSHAERTQQRRAHPTGRSLLWLG